MVRFELDTFATVFFSQLGSTMFFRLFNDLKPEGALAQLVARRSHNPKVVSSILTGPIILFFLSFFFSKRFSVLVDVFP